MSRVVAPNDKVSDGSQPPMMLDLAPEQNGWFPFAAPSCWLRFHSSGAQQVLSVAEVHQGATIHSVGTG